MIPAAIDELKGSIRSQRLSLTQHRLQLAQEASKLHELDRQVIERSIQILEQTIHGSVARGARAKADYLALVAEGMSKKVSLQNGQLLSQIYSPIFQEALANKSRELESQRSLTKRRLREVEERLEEYKNAKGMDDVVKEYAEVLKETEKVREDIARIEKAR